MEPRRPYQRDRKKRSQPKGSEENFFVFSPYFRRSLYLFNMSEQERQTDFFWGCPSCKTLLVNGSFDMPMTINTNTGTCKEHDYEVKTKATKNEIDEWVKTVSATRSIVNF